MAQNYYQILGVSPKATPEEIQAAYRALVAEVYPGVNRGEAEAGARMKEINRAYETLKDTEKRSVYDQTLSPRTARPKQQSTSVSRPGRTASTGPASGLFAEAFQTMREQAQTNATGTSKAPSSAGNSANTVEIWLTPREAIDGVEKKIKVDGKLIRLKIGIRH